MIISIATIPAFATNQLQCPTAEQLANLTVSPKAITPNRIYFSYPGFTSANQCSMAILIFAPAQEIAQAALGKAKLFNQEQYSPDITSCFYDKLPGQEKLGAITVWTYLPVEGSCTNKTIAN